MFRPVTESRIERTRVVELLLAHTGRSSSSIERPSGSATTTCTPTGAAHSEIVAPLPRADGAFDVVVVIGSDYTDVSTQSELDFNAQVAANLGCSGGAGGPRPRPHAGADPDWPPTWPATNWPPSTPIRSR